MSTSLARSETKMAESITDSCHSEPTVTAASNLLGQESSVCGNQLTKQADALHSRTVMNPARFPSLEFRERTNAERVLADRCDRTHAAKLHPRDDPLQKLLRLPKGTPHL